MDNLNRDPARYDDAQAFRPERFLGDDLEALVSARQRDYWKRDHVNYGFGRRMCPGMSLSPYFLSCLCFELFQLNFLQKSHTSRRKLAFHTNLPLSMGL